MNKFLVLATILLIGIITFNGCLSEGQGILELYITDAPGDLNITKALITIKSVEVHFNNKGSTKNNSSNGWKIISKETQTFDLITLQGVKEFLGSKLLEQGEYNQIRLYVDSAYVTINGITYNLKIPSKVIKIIKTFQIERRYITTLTLDFDIQKSIKIAGKNMYILKPSIKVI